MVIGHIVMIFKLSLLINLLLKQISKSSEEMWCLKWMHFTHQSQLKLDSTFESLLFLNTVVVTTGY